MIKLSQLRIPPPAEPPPPKFRGKSLTLSPLMFMLCSAFSVLSRAASAVTVTDSLEAPTWSVVSTRMVWATATSTFSWVDFLKPVASTFSSYLPTGSEARVKLPVSVVVVSKSEPFSRFLADTLAPGTTAAAGSVTEPVMVPRSLWANAATVNNRMHNVFRTSFIRASSHTYNGACANPAPKDTLNSCGDYIRRGAGLHPSKVGLSPGRSRRSEEHTSEL